MDDESRRFSAGTPTYYGLKREKSRKLYRRRLRLSLTQASHTKICVWYVCRKSRCESKAEDKAQCRSPAMGLNIQIHPSRKRTIRDSANVKHRDHCTQKDTTPMPYKYGPRLRYNAEWTPNREVDQRVACARGLKKSAKCVGYIATVRMGGSRFGVMLVRLQRWLCLRASF